MTALGESGSPLVTTLAAMTDASIRQSGLGPRELLLVRLACLVALDAGRTSYLYNLAGPAAPALTPQEVEAVLVAVAPLLGSARVVSAAERISEALGYAISMHDLMASGLPEQ